MVKLRKAWTIAVITSIGMVSLFVSHHILSQTISSHTQKVTMPTVIIRKSLTLRAWEEDPNFPPIGMPPDPNRPISYALLNVTFENTTLDRIEMKIKSVTVQSSQNGDILLALPESALTLGPLEISPQQYFLSSRKTYGQHRTVVGSLTYELNGQTYTLTTEAVPVR